jgi:hypothetical protein
MDAKVRVHGHFNGLKTTLLFALMWAIIMLIWWATGGSRQTLSIYIVIGLITTFGTYWFSDKLAIASMGAREVSEQEAPEIYQIVRELSAKAGKPLARLSQSFGRPPGIGLLMKWMTCERISGEIFGGWPSVAGGCFVCRWMSPNALATRWARRWPL